MIDSIDCTFEFRCNVVSALVRVLHRLVTAFFRSNRV